MYTKKPDDELLLEKKKISFSSKVQIPLGPISSEGELLLHKEPVCINIADDLYDWSVDPTRAPKFMLEKKLREGWPDE